jgi:hypothetical protein
VRGRATDGAPHPRGIGTSDPTDASAAAHGQRWACAPPNRRRPVTQVATASPGRPAGARGGGRRSVRRRHPR